MPIRSKELLDRIRELACTPVLLVATDYDGTIAPIVPDPDDAHADHHALIALRNLSELPSTHVGVISGRSLEMLNGFLMDSNRFHLVGSHGSEFDAGFATDIPVSARALLDRVQNAVRAISSQSPGLHAEIKPAGVCLHTRNAARADAESARRAVLEGPATWEGVYERHGKEVVELSVVDADKGAALQRLRSRLGATMCVFIGDDLTDEDAFRSMTGPDVSVKVGAGETCAGARLDDQSAVAPFLAALAEARAEWLAGSAPVPIQQHAMLSDHRTIALLTPDARVSWMCAPRVDSSAIFAELLGGPEAGYWSIAPSDEPSGLAVQTCVPDTMTVVTEWPTVRITDLLDCSGHRMAHQAGRVDLIRVIEGRGPVRIEFAPRLNFGRTPTALRTTTDGIIVSGGNELISLRAPGIAWTIVDRGAHQTATAEVELTESPLCLEFRYGTQNTGALSIETSRRRQQTEAHWSSWARSLHNTGRYAEQVRRSALILKALTYGPSGAIAAAGTTSLPEWIGGVRNWDYRYCWPRDASMSAKALVRLGSISEAMALLDWLREVVDRLSQPDALAPLYTVSGHEVPPEGEISELAGYAGSRPVRVGNAAALQLQLDVFGPIVDLVATLAEAGAPLSMWHWTFVERLADSVIRRWNEPDHGIWEPRVPPRHHVHTKVMCWQTLRRAGVVANLQLAEPTPKYDAISSSIREQVLAHGWSDRLGGFSGAYQSEYVDAAALWTGLSGMLDADDGRFRSTVEVIARRLLRRGAVYRYEDGDGLPGAEGAFNLCTSWLIEAMVMIGDRDRAEELFQEYLRLAGQTGLLAEEVDPESGRALGNVPQAYSHLGLINAALCLEHAD